MKPGVILGVALFAALATGASPALAQTFRTYVCADGSQFIAGFFQYDKHAHLQIDGKAVALKKRLALSGSRYSGGGIVLNITRTGATIKHGKRPVSACSVR
ncbi:MliC family protein [Bradyrhizobium sp.]|jgi:membrane-bound inhibitor of C-type lysozyme|uniref:MliC family protein n=1 Tax=Bradyrhizobium sp. TaxID=376 RepID=UPI002E06FDCC|nr:MliC family protein [Bradyrhizobium sp.]